MTKQFLFDFDIDLQYSPASPSDASIVLMRAFSVLAMSCNADVIVNNGEPVGPRFSRVGFRKY